MTAEAGELALALAVAAEVEHQGGEPAPVIAAADEVVIAAAADVGQHGGELAPAYQHGRAAVCVDGYPMRRAG